MNKNCAFFDQVLSLSSFVILLPYAEHQINCRLLALPTTPECLVFNRRTMYS